MKSSAVIKGLFSLTLIVIIILHAGCKKDNDSLPLSEIPTIASVTPEEGTINTELTITGTNFKAGAVVYIGGKASTDVETLSGSVIYAKVPSGITANTLLSVEVENPGGGKAVLNNVFKAIEPELSFINSATKPSGNAGSTVIIEGRAFGDIQGQGEILFSDGAEGTIAATIADAEDWTDEFIVTTVPGGAKDGPVVVKTEIGISGEIPFRVTDAATFSPSTITWTETSELPHGVSGHQALSIAVENMNKVINQYVFVSGGIDGDGQASDQVLSGLINANGTISSWSNTTSLPEPRSFHSSVAATPFNSKVDGSGYVYLLGGKDSYGDVISDVTIGVLNDDGTLQAWETARALPQAVHSGGAVIFRSTIYVAGGATADNEPVSKVYKAKIMEDGQLEEWETLPELPYGVAHHGFVAFGGYLYSVGGETGIVLPDAGEGNSGTKQIFYSKINLRNGDIDDWTLNPAELGKERSKHSTLVLGGSLFVSSGLYSGLTGNTGGSSENAYASIKPDGTIDSFGGATGSNTLFGTGGSNLFNQSGISYIDSEGVAHVMIIGGAKVGSPGTMLDKVFYY